MAFLLLVCDPDEKVWTVLVQSDTADAVLDEIDKGDPSLRLAINTDDYITYDTREEKSGG